MGRSSRRVPIICYYMFKSSSLYKELWLSRLMVLIGYMFCVFVNKLFLNRRSRRMAKNQIEIAIGELIKTTYQKLRERLKPYRLCHVGLNFHLFVQFVTKMERTRTRERS